MNIKEILEYKIFEVGSFGLSVYTVLLFLIIYVGARIALYVFRRFFHRVSQKRRLDPGRQHSFFLMFQYLIWLIAIVMILSTAGLKLTWIVASSAALLVGLGFGLQQIFADFLSGIILLFEGTVEKGDIIEVDGVVGRIEEIHLRTTQFRNRDDQMMIIPNHKFVNDNVVNWSFDNHVSRFSVAVGVSYNSDILKVKKILLECANANSDLMTDVSELSPRVRLDNFGDSSVDFTLLFYSTNLFRIETVKSDLRFAIWAAFQQNKVEIPFPQRDLHLKSGPWLQAVPPETKENQ